MNILFENLLTILPGDDGLPVCIPASVYVAGGIIVAVNDKPENFIADKTISGDNLILSPGLINAHTHAYMNAFRNSADDLAFSDWLFGRIIPMEAKLSKEDAEKFAWLACREMLSNGITCFSDMHMFPMSSVRAAMKTGIRAVISRGLSRYPDDLAAGEKRLKEAMAEIEQTKREFSDSINTPPGDLSDTSPASKISFMLAPHAPYSCDEGYLREIAALSNEKNLPIHTHLSESLGECDAIREKYNLTPTEFFARCGILKPGTVAAHCVHLTDGDIAILADNSVSVATNPVSNLKLGNGVAPVPRLMRAGVNVCLGTDSAASNNSLSILRELAFVSLIHKGLSGDMTAVTAREAFLMATKNGALALGLSDTGEIRAGCNADLTLLDTGAPGCQPLGDPIAAICYSGSAMEVRLTMVGGEIVYERERGDFRFV